jgi:RNA polymerase sigma-70 factor (ECF subfamily)
MLSYAMVSSAKPDRAVPPRRLRAVDTPAPSEESIIAGVLDGERWAHAALYDALLPVVSRTLYKLLRDATDFEDLVQTTFERIVVALLEKKRRIDNLSGLAGAIASRVAIDALRAKIRTRRLFGSDAEHARSRTSEAAPSAHRQLEARQDLAILQRVLGRMKPDHAQVLILCDVLGHDLGEAAVLIGDTIGATQRRLSRARKELLRRAPGYLSGGSGS